MQTSLIAGLIAIAVAAPAADNALTPGYWQESTLFHIDSVDGKPPAADAFPDDKDTTKTCYDAEQTSSIAHFLNAGVEKDCAGIKIDAQDGKLAISGSCDFQGTSMAITGAGSYSPASLSFTFHGTANANGHPAALSGSYDGRNIGACPPEPGPQSQPAGTPR